VRLLVLGGTRFLGRAIVDAALARGHQLTLFNRGISNPDLFPGLETVHGDRRQGLAPLAGRQFDAVVDVAAMTPDHVAPAVDALESAVDRYLFVSTVSVYADHSVPQREEDAVIELREGLDFGAAYGANKAAAERVVVDAFGDRALVVRPGFIVGPYDQTDRFAYWPRRIARGGRVLAPPAEHSTQFIDVRDLARWIVLGAEKGLGGTYNATGPTGSMGQLIDACLEAVATPSCSIEWASDAQLLAAGLDPWMGIPMWIAAPGWEGANQVVTERAQAAGLIVRPLGQTVADTLAWDLARGGPDPGNEGLSAAREAEILGSITAEGPLVRSPYD
jgi:2'-hydroxyisoflavone reductase